MNVPFVDLRAQHDELRSEIDTAIKEAIDRSQFIGGPLVEEFERGFAAYCGSRFAIGCSSGTDALKLALMAIGVKPGDAVVTVPLTFIGTVEPITMIGARPVFVDVDPRTYTMSPIRLHEYLEAGCVRDGDGRLVDRATDSPVTAILPVHLYGLPADMAPIMGVAAHWGLRVVEDACQAHGAVYRGGGDEVSRAGTIGHVGAFSFYPGKNLGAMGEAGAATTDDPEMARRMRIWRDHGQSQRYVHVSADGWNGRLDAIQAAVLTIKLRKLDDWNERRRRAAQWYRERLQEAEPILLPVEPAYGHHVYHLYAVRISERDRARGELADKGIGTGLHYPIPLHLQDAYRNMGLVEGSFPEAERLAVELLSLPMYPHIAESQVDYVCRSLRQSLGC